MQKNISLDLDEDKEKIKNPKLRDFNNKLISLAHKLESFIHDSYLKVSKKDNNFKLGGKKAYVLLYLYLKAFFIFKDFVHLLEYKKVHAPAYLLRGLIEIRADIEYFSEASEPECKRFFLYGLEILKIINRGNMFKKELPKFDKYFFGKKSIRQRIKKSDSSGICLWFYDYLCTICHSSGLSFFLYNPPFLREFKDTDYENRNQQLHFGIMTMLEMTEFLFSSIFKKYDKTKLESLATEFKKIIIIATKSKKIS